MNRYEVEKAIQTLEKEGLLDYGAIIPVKIMENILGINCSETWEFRGPLLEFRLELMERGYLCTTAGIEYGAIKIYDVDELAIESDRIFKRHLRGVKRLQQCISNIDQNEFSQLELKKLMHVSNKVTSGLRALKSSLNDI